MPLEVVDARTEAPSRILRSRTLWEGPDFGKHVAAVRRVVEDVREQGDEALVRYSKSVYGAALSPDRIRVTPDERDAGAAAIDPKVISALEGAAERIRDYHDTQKPGDWSMDREGATVGQVFRAVRRVGLHAPAGGYPLPSSFLMTVIPAQSAGVEEIAVCCPAGPEGDAPVMMAAAKVAGVDELYRIGGAHAIAALAIGTDTVKPCDKVCGPGGLYTALAKREVLGTVGIDGFYGPSEAAVVADETARPDYAAAELLKEAEHGPDSVATLITTSEAFLGQCLQELEVQLRRLKRADDVRDTLAAHGLAIVVRDLDQAADLVNQVAPEHLCIHVADPEGFLAHVRAAGTALLGADTPATLSDYCAGPSAVLPTGGAARHTRGLSVLDFLVAINTVSYTGTALFRDAHIADALSEAEGMAAHRAALHLRLEEPGSAVGGPSN
jgi:histidinol dehydrogenase